MSVSAGKCAVTVRIWCL